MTKFIKLHEADLNGALFVNPDQIVFFSGESDGGVPFTNIQLRDGKYLNVKEDPETIYNSINQNR